MYAAVIPHDADAAAFRILARRCFNAGLSPRQIVFADADAPSLLPPLPELDGDPPAILMPLRFAEMVADVFCHSAADRFALLYQALWRIQHGERELMTRLADPTVARLDDYAHAVRRDIHKMHAFVRFRETQAGGETLYTAWFEPQHRILRRAVPFFVDRFPNMHWLIVTPQGSAAWRAGTLRYGPPPQTRPAQAGDAVLDEVWLAYYRATFNPARVRLKAMTAEMPKHYWRNMPETAAIPAMVATAPSRLAVMAERQTDVAPMFADRIAQRQSLPDIGPVEDLAELRLEARGCQRCPLHGPATQTVFGEGPRDAAMMFVGEQPGDREDLAGKPFVGPAGELFDRALAEAGIGRASVYVTNAVKHFKYEPRGKRRIHKRPNAGEVQTCKRWLDREIAAVKPRLIVALGATAAQSLLGRAVSVLKERGQTSIAGQAGFITVHPSYLLSLQGQRAQADEYRRFVGDLRQALELLAGGAAKPPRSIN
jgi:DNA polymerase